MRVRLSKVVVPVSLVLSIVSSAPASELPSLVNPAVGSTSYSLGFTANAGSATVSFAGYQNPSFEYASDIGVFGSGPANLLSQAWALVPAAAGSETKQYDDGTSVNALAFGGLSLGNFDTYSQTFATTPGKAYELNFMFIENDTGPSAFQVGTSETSIVPLPGALPMFGTLIAGLIGVASGSRAIGRLSKSRH